MFGSPTVPLSSRLAGPAPHRSRCSAGFPAPHRAAARAGGLAIVAMSVASCSSMRYSSAFNPSVTVEVEHPPGVGFVVEEVVFAEESLSRGGRSSAAEAGCEAEWVQVLTEWLVDQGVRVGRRGDERYADAVIAVNVTRCETEQDRSEGSKEIVERVGDDTRRRTVTEHHARTRVTFRATFEVTDLVDRSRGRLAHARLRARDSRFRRQGAPGIPVPGSRGEASLRQNHRRHRADRVPLGRCKETGLLRRREMRPESGPPRG